MFILTISYKRNDMFLVLIISGQCYNRNEVRVSVCWQNRPDCRFTIYTAADLTSTNTTYDIFIIVKFNITFSIISSSIYIYTCTMSQP